MPIPILSPLSRPKLLGKEIQIFYDKWIKMDGQTGGCVLLWHKAQSALRLNIANALIRVRKAHPRLFCAPGTIPLSVPTRTPRISSGFRRPWSELRSHR